MASTLDAQVGQHRPQHADDPLHVVRAVRRKGIARIVADVVGRDDLVGHRELALAPQLLAPAQRHRLVPFGHGASSRHSLLRGDARGERGPKQHCRGRRGGLSLPTGCLTCVGHICPPSTR